MAKRWTQPPGGLDVGRLGRRRRAGAHQPDHPREGAPGRARGRGRRQLLPEPAPRLPGWHRAQPAALPAPARARPRTWPATPRSSSTCSCATWPKAIRVRRRLGRRRGDPVAAVLHPVGLARPRRCRVRRRRRRGRGGRLLQRLSRRGRPRRPVATTPGGDGRGHASFAHHLGLEHMAFHGRAGPRRAGRPGAPPRPRLEGRRPARRSQEIMAADDVVVEPGDMLLFHTGFATKVLEWNREPDPVRDPPHVHLPRRPGRRRCSSGSPTRRSRRWSPTTTRSRGWCGPGPRRRAGTRCCRSTTCACSSSACPLGELWYLHELATWLREHDRSRFLLTAPPLRLPGAVGCPRHPGRHRLTAGRRRCSGRGRVRSAEHARRSRNGAKSALDDLGERLEAASVGRPR